MSARAELTGGVRSERAETLASSMVVAVGCVLLAVRPLAAATLDTRVVLFGATYVLVALAAIAVPVEHDGSRLSPVWALGLGAAALVAAAWASGPSIPLPVGPATLPLSVLAAVAEEALFRRVAYARLERFGAVVAVAGSAVLFGLVHVPAYGLAALPVDVGAGLVFGWQRWASGTWTVPAATHAFANAMVILR